MSEDDAEASSEELEGSERTKKKALGSVCKAVKVGIVGDGTVGKTTMLLSYTCQAFITDYVPTVFDNFSVIEDVDGMKINVILWDTAGQEDYSHVRTLCYDNTDLFLVCFSMVHPNSFLNVKSKWLPELKQHAPNTPFILVGTKTDLIEDPHVLEELKLSNETVILSKDAQKKSKELGAKLYLECSGSDVVSVNKVFYESLKWLTERDRARLQKEQKAWKRDIKEEQKLEAKFEKMRVKEEKKQAKKADKSDRDRHSPPTDVKGKGKEKERSDDD